MMKVCWRPSARGIPGEPTNRTNQSAQRPHRRVNCWYRPMAGAPDRGSEPTHCSAFVARGGAHMGLPLQARPSRPLLLRQGDPSGDTALSPSRRCATHSTRCSRATSRRSARGAPARLLSC
jgi:hypothetical protein